MRQVRHPNALRVDTPSDDRATATAQISRTDSCAESHEYRLSTVQSAWHGDRTLLSRFHNLQIGCITFRLDRARSCTPDDSGH